MKTFDMINWTVRVKAPVDMNDVETAVLVERINARLDLQTVVQTLVDKLSDEPLVVEVTE